MPPRCCLAALLLLLGACSAAPGAADGGAGGDDAAAAPWELDPQRIYDDVVRLSADDMAGRTPGGPGGVRALDYVEGVFRDLGLAPGGELGYRQFFEVRGWHLTAAPTLALDGAPLAHLTDYGVLGGSGRATAEVVFVGHAVTVPPFDPAAHPDCPFDPLGYDDFADVDLTGKVALAVYGLHRGWNSPLLNYCPGLASGADNAATHGAVAYVEVPAATQTDWLVARPDTSGYPYPVPFVVATRAAVAAAVPDLDAREAATDETFTPRSVATGVTADLEVAGSTDAVGTANVIGEVPGTSPELGAETIVLGAHVDAVGLGFPGADDDASGVAVLLELARGAVRGDLRPARTVVFAVFEGEETGHWGSTAYCDRPPRPLDRTALMLSVDMVGGGDASGLILRPGDLSPPVDWVAAALQDAGAAAGVAGTVQVGATTGNSDHACFARAGVPAMLVSTPGPHVGYHTPADRPERLDRDDLATAARLLWAGLKPLARGEVAIPAR